MRASLKPVLGAHGTCQLALGVRLASQCPIQVETREVEAATPKAQKLSSFRAVAQGHFGNPFEEDSIRSERLLEVVDFLVQIRSSRLQDGCDYLRMNFKRAERKACRRTAPFLLKAPAANGCPSGALRATSWPWPCSGGSIGLGFRVQALRFRVSCRRSCSDGPCQGNRKTHL